MCRRRLYKQSCLISFCHSSPQKSPRTPTVHVLERLPGSSLILQDPGIISIIKPIFFQNGLGIPHLCFYNSDIKLSVRINIFYCKIISLCFFIYLCISTNNIGVEGNFSKTKFLNSSKFQELIFVKYKCLHA